MTYSQFSMSHHTRLLFSFIDWFMNLVIKNFTPIKTRKSASQSYPSWKHVCHHELFERVEFAMASYKDRYIIIAGGNKGKREHHSRTIQAESGSSGLKSAGIYDMQAHRHTELPNLPETFHCSHCGGRQGFP